MLRLIARVSSLAFRFSSFGVREPLLRAFLAAIFFTTLFTFINTSSPRAVSANGSCTNSGPTDFADCVSDILGGRRLLFPVDDVVVGLSAEQIDVTTTIVQTENGGLGNQIPYGVTQAPDAFAVGAGRMFNLPRDVVVTLTTGTITISDEDPNNPVNLSLPLNANAPVNQNQLAKADFTGDGLDDFAYIMQGALYFVTAQDVNVMFAGVFVSDAGIPTISTQGWTTLTAGDFNGDGTQEIALAPRKRKTILSASKFLP